MQKRGEVPIRYGRGVKRVLTTIGESDPYKPTYLSQLFHKERYRALVAVIRELSKGCVKSLLDVGCGKGFLYRSLLQAGVRVYEYICLDIDGSKLERAGGLRVCADAHIIPINTCSVDFTVASEVLEHLEKPLLALKNMLTVTRRYLILTFPDETVKNALGFKYPEHISRIDLREIVVLTNRYAFKPILHYVLNYPIPPSVYDKFIDYSERPLRLLEALQNALRTVGSLCMIKTHIMVFQRTSNC